MSEKISVTGCIVTYNSAAEIEKCIDSVLRFTRGVDFRLYVSDNGSSDGTAELVREIFPAVTVLTGENVGFGGGHNRVLPLLDSRYHVMINPDIQLQEDAITALVQYLETHPEAGQIGPDILNPDGTRQELPKRDPRWLYMFGGRLPGGKKLRSRYCRTEEKLSRPTEIEFCSGCFNIVRTDLFREIGGFDERYFLYMEDADLSRTVRKTHKVIFDPEVRVTHLWHRASGHSAKALKLHLASARKYFAKWRREQHGK